MSTKTVQALLDAVPDVIRDHRDIGWRVKSREHRTNRTTGEAYLELTFERDDSMRSPRVLWGRPVD
jgi:hypothetical protein